MHIKDQNQSFSFFLLAQFIVYTKVPIWVGAYKKGVLKGWVGLGTCILKRACSKGGTKEHMHTTFPPWEKQEIYNRGKERESKVGPGEA